MTRNLLRLAVATVFMTTLFSTGAAPAQADTVSDARMLAGALLAGPGVCC